MPFLSEVPPLEFTKPVLALLLGNTMLSTVPGISGAGPSPEKTLLTPVLDAELIATGAITSMPLQPNTPTGCPTPATITRSMAGLTGVAPVFVNTGLVHKPTVPCIDVYGEAGADPRKGDAVKHARELFERGRYIGKMLGKCGDLLVLGECVPGGTTSALCVLRAFGYDARVSSSFVENPHSLKDEVCNAVMDRLRAEGISHPFDIVRVAGDPMIPVAAGITDAYEGEVVLAGGTQMLAVAALLKRIGDRMPLVTTTVFLRDDPSASFSKTVDQIGAKAIFVDPDFGDIGHAGLARYCIGEVKEGAGAGGAMFLAYMMGHSPEEIKQAILGFVNQYS